MILVGLLVMGRPKRAAEGGLIYANAGHTSGLIITDDEVKTLDPTGPIRGPLPDIPLQRGYEVIRKGAIFKTLGVGKRSQHEPVFQGQPTGKRNRSI